MARDYTTDRKMQIPLRLTRDAAESPPSQNTTWLKKEVGAMSAGKMTCDSCGREYTWKLQLAGKRVKCKCGASFNVPVAEPAEEYPLDGLGAGEPVTPAAYNAPAYTPAAAGAAPSGPASPTRMPGAGRSAKFKDDEMKRHEIKKMVTIGVALVVIIVAVVGAKFAFNLLGGSSKKNLPGLDSRVAQMTDDHGATEVLQWLNENQSRGVVAFAWTRGKTEAKAREWYDHGAKKVLAFGGVMTACLAIELPDDKDKRAYFFDYIRQYMQENFPSQPPQRDEDQKYIVVDFGIVSG
jgi:hypothetical protein